MQRISTSLGSIAQNDCDDIPVITRFINKIDVGIIRGDKVLDSLGRLKHKEIYILAIIMLGVYLLTLSPSLDDFDSVNFALALDEYNVAKFQPQPPGHPGYIFIGKLFYLVFGDHILALTVQSAVFGALSLVVFYFLAEEMFNKRAALFSAMLLGFTPMYWLNSLKAMSDITSLFFVLLSMLFLYRYLKRKQAMDAYIASVAAGISISIRFPTTAFILVPLFIYAFIAVPDKRHWRILVSVNLIIITLLALLIPAIAMTGAREYISSTNNLVFGYRTGNAQVSMLGAPLSAEYLGERAYDFLHSFLRGGYGIDIASLGVVSIILLAVIAIVLAFGIYKTKIKDQRLHFFLIGLLPYIIAVFAMLPARDSRHLLPLIPVISLLLVFAASNVIKYRGLIFFIMLGLVIAHSLPAAITIHTQDAPPVQMIEHIRENYNLANTVVLASGFNARYFDFYGKGMNVKIYPSLQMVDDYVNANMTVLVAEMDSRYSNVFNEIHVKSFIRDPMANEKNSKEHLYEITGR